MSERTEGPHLIGAAPLFFGAAAQDSLDARSSFSRMASMA